MKDRSYDLKVAAVFFSDPKEGTKLWLRGILEDETVSKTKKSEIFDRFRIISNDVAHRIMNLSLAESCFVPAVA